MDQWAQAFIGHNHQAQAGSHGHSGLLSGQNPLQTAQNPLHTVAVWQQQALNQRNLAAGLPNPVVAAVETRNTALEALLAALLDELRGIRGAMHELQRTLASDSAKSGQITGGMPLNALRHSR